jgi:hypothetical protein
LLTVTDVMARYRLRDRRAARRIMDAAGSFRMGAGLFVRLSDLLAYRAGDRPGPAALLLTDGALRLAAETMFRAAGEAGLRRGEVIGPKWHPQWGAVVNCRHGARLSVRADRHPWITLRGFGARCYGRPGDLDQQRSPMMAKVAPFHSAAPNDPKVYHDNNRCTEGNNIEPRNKRSGTEGYPKGQHCSRLS